MKYVLLDDTEVFSISQGKLNHYSQKKKGTVLEGNMVTKDLTNDKGVIGALALLELEEGGYIDPSVLSVALPKEELGAKKYFPLAIAAGAVFVAVQRNMSTWETVGMAAAGAFVGLIIMQINK